MIRWNIAKTKELSILGKRFPSLRPSLSVSSCRACHAQVKLVGVRNLRFLYRGRSPVEIRSRDIAGATLGTYHLKLRQATPQKRRRTSGLVNLWWHFRKFVLSIILITTYCYKILKFTLISSEVNIDFSIKYASRKICIKIFKGVILNFRLYFFDKKYKNRCNTDFNLQI